MKKLLLITLSLFILCSAAAAETAREYAAWLEEALPGAGFTDAPVPDFVLKNLGNDYEFIARADPKYGSYIAGVRREDAPRLPDDIEVSIGGTFDTTVFRAQDSAGKVYYNFVLGDGVYMQAYDSLKHIIIHANENHTDYEPFAAYPSSIFSAADSLLRAQMLYVEANGFSPEDDSHTQLGVAVHTIDTWRAGVTREPHTFFLDVETPENLLGERYLTKDKLISFTRIPIGLYMKDGKTTCGLVFSESGVKGVETYEPHRLYEAGADFDALVELAEGVLGYRPGNADFLGKKSVRATLEWQAGSASIEDAEALRRLDEMLSRADFSIGSVKCPSPCFLTVEFTDGSFASMAVAINSFDLFFYNGLYFTAGNGELLDIFKLNMEDIINV